MATCLIVRVRMLQNLRADSKVGDRGDGFQATG